jgi:hypothetical protein
MEMLEFRDDCLEADPMPPFDDQEAADDAEEM